MAQSNFTLYKYIKLAEGLLRYCGAAFYSNGKSNPTVASWAARRKSIPRVLTTFTTRSSGLPWAPMPWKHNASGTCDSTKKNQETAWNGSDAEDNRRTDLGKTPLTVAAESISRTSKLVVLIPRASEHTALV